MNRKNDNCELSVIIPLYDEEESLRELYERIIQAAEKTVQSFEIIFIDDGSQDDSLKILQALHERDSRVKVISFRKNYGKSAALSEGFHYCSGDIVITMDADLQDDPAEIPHLIKKINEGYDLVSGWKKKRYDPWLKKVTSKFYNFVTSRMSGITLHDFNCGLKAYRRAVVKEIRLYGQLHRFVPVLAHWQGFRVGEVVVQHHARKFGKTKFGPSRFAHGFFDILTVMFLLRFKRRPLHLFGLMGMVCFVIGSAITLYLGFQRIVYSMYLSRRPILFLGILLIIVGVQFISLGLLGEMVSESRDAKDGYSIKQKIGIS